MLKWFKWIVAALFWGFIGLTLHYTLPQRDIVYATGVEIKREDLGRNAFFWASSKTGSDVSTSRDIRFVDSVRPNGKVMVYRNEDTGWGWPPYFKLNSANLQAEIRNVVSTSADPRWVVVRHYGWRVEFMSIYPNAISVWEVDSPNADIGWPWFNTIFLGVFALVSGALFLRWRRFKAARLDPMGDAIEDRLDMAAQTIGDRSRRLGRWWKNR
jgi:hypothetical protein